MKNPKSNLVLILLVMFVFASCVKEIKTPEVPVNTDPQNLSELQAANNFDWSTTGKINFQFNGLPGENQTLVLKVKDPDGNVIMQKLQKASENFRAVLIVPSRFEELIVEYGSRRKELDCTSGSIYFYTN